MSKPNEQVFTGTSTSGNLQEALDNAVSQIGHGQAWRLASIDGLVGGVAGNDVNVRIFAVAGAPAADAARRPGGEPGEPHETRQGTVEAIPEGTLSFCQDGAEYELVTITPEGEERLRLRAKGRAESVLRRYAGTGEEVSVTGPVSHVECTVMDVVEAHPVRAAAGSPQD
jgi:hypothetical protein